MRGIGTVSLQFSHHLLECDLFFIYNLKFFFVRSVTVVPISPALSSSGIGLLSYLLRPLHYWSPAQPPYSGLVILCSRPCSSPGSIWQGLKMALFIIMGGGVQLASNG